MRKSWLVFTILLLCTICLPVSPIWHATTHWLNGYDFSLQLMQNEAWAKGDCGLWPIWSTHGPLAPIAYPTAHSAWYYLFVLLALLYRLAFAAFFIQSTQNQGSRLWKLVLALFLLLVLNTYAICIGLSLLLGFQALSKRRNTELYWLALLIPLAFLIKPMVLLASTAVFATVLLQRLVAKDWKALLSTLPIVVALTAFTLFTKEVDRTVLYELWTGGNHAVAVYPNSALWLPLLALAVLGFGIWKAQPGWPALLAILLLLLSMRYAFGRQDLAHMSFLLQIGVLLSLLYAPTAVAARKWAWPLALLSIALLSMANYWTFGKAYKGQLHYRGWAAWNWGAQVEQLQSSIGQVEGASCTTQGTVGFPFKNTLAGTTDAPLAQGYQAYTPHLDSLYADYLKNRKVWLHPDHQAPNTILGQYGGHATPKVWTELLGRSVKESCGSGLLFMESTEKVQWDSIQLKLNEWISLEEHAEICYGKSNLSENFAGRVLTVFLRPAPLELIYENQEGELLHYPVNLRQLRSGVVLLPLYRDARWLAPEKVKRVKLVGAERYYKEGDNE